VVGSISPRASTLGEEADFIVNQNGVYYQRSGAVDHISQEIATGIWDRINMSAKRLIWSCNDVKQRILYIGLPLDDATEPSHILTMSYRSCRDGELPEPLRSNISGKLSTSDLVRKWALWPIPSKDGAMIEQADGSFVFKVAASGFGNAYTLDLAKYTDDDFGTISSSYTTWFFIDDDTAEQLQIGSHRKLVSYLTCSASGTGNLRITPYVGGLDNPGKPSKLMPLNNTTKFIDLETNMNVVGERITFKFEVFPFAGQTDAKFTLKSLVVTVRSDPWSPIAGRI
jgi:hypothetical protein